MCKNIKLFISSYTQGFVKINNGKAFNAENTLYIELEIDTEVLLEFCPISSGKASHKALATFVKLYFDGSLKFIGENVELIKYNFDTYELVFKENKLEYSSTNVMSQKLLESGNAKILVTLFENKVVVQDENFLVSHVCPIVLAKPSIFSYSFGGDFYVCVEDKTSGYLLIINHSKNFDVAYEDTCSMLKENKVFKKICYLDSKKRKSTSTFKNENGYFVLEKKENENDTVNFNVPKNDLLFTYLFIDSFLAGFENECMGYLSDTLKEKIDFETLKSFLGEFVDIKQNIYVLEKDAPLVLVYKKEDGYFTTAFLKVEIKNNLIDNILVF